MRSVKRNNIIVFFCLLIFCTSCVGNVKLSERDKTIESFGRFINVKTLKGSVIQNDTSQFVITFSSPTKLKYYNSNFGRGSYKNYQFEIVLQDILEKPLFVTTTNYYGVLQFDWILKKKGNQYVLQMVSNIKKGFVIDEFRFKKAGKYYSLDMVYNIIPIDTENGRGNQVCSLSSTDLSRDTINCTVDKFIDCKMLK